MKDLSFLGVDISKDSITVYDGKKLYTFPSERYLEKFKERIFKRLNKEKTVIIYEPTGPYSSFLEEFAAIEKINGDIPSFLCPPPLYQTPFYPATPSPNLDTNI